MKALLIIVNYIDKERRFLMIEFQNVSKLYGDKEALSNLNLQMKMERLWA